MDFTREPIIETIITPKDGYKLVVRSSKSAGQEEYFVDAVEVVAFGNGLFFRSSDKPKAFLVPVSDYEILEVREARMVLKNAGPDRSIKIGGGREASHKPPREQVRQEEHSTEEPESEQTEQHPAGAEATATLDKKRDRRRHSRKRRGRDEEASTEEAPPAIPQLEDGAINIPAPEADAVAADATTPLSPSVLSSLLQPPPTLISETINRYRENALFKSAFFMTEDEEFKPHDKVQDLLSEDDDADFDQPLQEPTYAEEEPTPPENNEPAFEEAGEPETPHDTEKS